MTTQMVAKRQGRILDRNLFKKWLSFLLLTNKESKNKEVLFDYFFDTFSRNSQSSYHFLYFFKESLEKIKNPREEKILAERYLEIFSPLCERFGFFHERNILDDLCFKISNPHQYAVIDRLLENYKKKSHTITEDILTVLEELLKKEKYKAEIKGRYKHIYSIYKKLKKYGFKNNIVKLNDIFAFRIILKHNSISECFEILNLLHDRFTPITDFFKDYISVPKVNGYQSVHAGLTNIIPHLDLPIDVQIRTQAMDDFAERGVAAHWLYAHSKKSQVITEKEAKLINYFSSLHAPPDQNARVYCFSYKGDIFKLEKGSTILDFAYRIHSELGNRLKGAIVNGSEHDIDYVIKEGDLIRLKTASKPRVNETWLSRTHTKYARKKIDSYLKAYA